MSQENFCWCIKAMQMTLSALIAIGIFARWNTTPKASKPLAFMFLSIAIFYVVDFILSFHYQMHPFILRQGIGLGYSFGALYNGVLIITSAYVYARALFKPQKLYFRSFFTANILVISSLSTYALLSLLGYEPQPGYGFKELMNHLWDDPFALLWLLTIISFYLYVIYVCRLSLRWMFIHQRNLRNNFSLGGGLRYYYVYIICGLFFSMIPIGIVTLWFESDSLTIVIPGIAFIVIIILIYIFSNLQQDLYSEQLPMRDIESLGEEEGRQSIKVNDRRLIEKLEVLITQEEIYKLPNLSAESLAERLEISRKKLYLFLKEHYNTSFSDYINGCRIDFAQRMISNDNNLNMSILEISEIAGFNSTSTFNKFFKAKYHTSPAKYRNSLVISNQIHTK